MPINPSRPEIFKFLLTKLTNLKIVTPLQTCNLILSSDACSILISLYLFRLIIGVFINPSLKIIFDRFPTIK